MKSAIFRVLLAALVVSASGVSVSEVSAEPDGEQLEQNGGPAANLFDKNRVYVPEKLKYKDDWWECGEYQDDGLCTKVQIVEEDEDVKSEQIKSQSSEADDDYGDGPCTCLFDENRVYVPEKLKYRGDWWECSEYLDNGICAKVQIVEDAEVE